MVVGSAVISRESTPWRDLPQLRVKEAAELAGLSLRGFEIAADGELEFRRIGRVRFVKTAEFRRWVGDLEAEELTPVEAPSADTRRAARAFLRSVR